MQQVSRQLQKAATRAKILTVAKNLLEKQGYDQTTLRAIARESAVATGSIFVHFANKEDLFYSAFYDDLQNLMETHLAVPIGPDLAEDLTRIVNGYYTAFAARPALYIPLLQLSLFAAGEWGGRFRSQVETFGLGITQRYQAAIERGVLARETQAQIATASFLALYYFCLITLINQRFADLTSAQQLFALMLNQHLQGLKHPMKEPRYDTPPLV